MTIKVKLLNENAALPTRAHARDAGMDVYAPYDFTVEAGYDHLMKTGLAFEIPEGHYLQVATKSGIGTKRKLAMDIAGVIDEEYRGETGVQIWNLGKEPQHFKKGDKVAQFLCLPVSYPEIVGVDELSETSRGAHGFGSDHKA